MAYFSPYITGAVPRWVYINAAVDLFLYQTLDALDGKQARRTGTSSPLGELFDHGCDAVTTVLVVLTAASTIQMGADTLLYIFVIACLLAFYLKQWEELHTGTMKLGYANVTEAQLTTITVFLITAYYGGDLWLNETSIFGWTVPYRYLAALFGFLGSVYTILESIITVSLFYVKKPHSSPSSTPNTWQKAVFDLLPMVTLIVFSALWIRANPAVFTKHPHQFLLVIGFLFANFVGRVVLAKVCADDFHPIQPLLIPFVLGYVNAALQGILFPEEAFLHLLLVGCIGAYFFFALGVIHDICHYLKIRCLSIPKNPSRPTKKT